MTSEEYDKLTDEEKQIEVAKLCGFESWTDEYGTGQWERNRKAEDPPDYLNDLNAMHKAEMLLDDVQYAAYWQHLVNVCVATGYARMTSTTAAQRAKAFVLTKERLWMSTTTYKGEV